MATAQEIRDLNKRSNADLRKKQAELTPNPTRRPSGRLSIQQNTVVGANAGGSINRDGTSAPSSGRTAPAPTPVADVERVGEDVDFTKFGLPKGTISSEDPKSIAKTKLLPKYNPPKGEKVTEAERLSYDLNYTKKALEISAAETASIRTGVGAEQEKQAGETVEAKAADKAEDIKADVAAERSNPQFTALTTEQKQINRLREERGDTFIPDTVQAGSETGSVGNFTRRQVTSAMKMVNSSNANTRAAGQKILDAFPQGVKDNFKRFQEQVDSGEAMDDITEEEGIIRDELGMNDTDELTFDEDGRPLINGKTESEDAQERAKTRSDADRTDRLREMSQAQGLKLDRVTSAYTVNGRLTDQGAVQLARDTRDYNENVATVNRKFDENIHDVLKAERRRGAKVKAANAKAESPQARNNRIIAQERADGAFALQNEYAAKGIDKSFEAALSEYKSRQVFNSKGPSFAQKSISMDAQMASPQFDPDTAFAQAMTQFGGNGNDATKYLESRLFTESDIAEQKKQFQIDVLGYSPQEVADEQKERSLKSRMEAGLRGELDEDEMETLQLQLQTGTTKTAFQYNYALDNPGADALEMEQAWRSGTKAPSKAKVAKAPKELSSNAQLFIQDFDEFEIETVTDNALIYGLSASDKRDLAGQVLRNRANTPEESEVTEDIITRANIISDGLNDEDEPGFWKSIGDKLSGMFGGESSPATISTRDSALDRLRNIE